MPDFIEYNSLAAGPGVAIGSAITVANSDDNGTDPLDFALPSATGAVGTYQVLPWTIGGAQQVGGVIEVTSGTEAAGYLRWDHKTGNTERRGVVVLPVWLEQARPTTTGTPQISLCGIRNTSGTTMSGLKLDDNARSNQLVATAGNTDQAALEGTTVLQPQHLYWVGLAATNDGLVEWVLWDSDRVTVLETKSATGLATGTVSPGEYRFAGAASTAVPRRHYLQHIQGGEFATGWPARPFTVSAPASFTSDGLEGRRITPAGTGPFTLSSVARVSGATVSGLQANGLDITFLADPTRTTDVVIGFSITGPSGTTTGHTVTVPPPAAGGQVLAGTVERLYCDGTTWA